MEEKDFLNLSRQKFIAFTNKVMPMFLEFKDLFLEINSLSDEEYKPDSEDFIVELHYHFLLIMNWARYDTFHKYNVKVDDINLLYQFAHKARPQTEMMILLQNALFNEDYNGEFFEDSEFTYSITESASIELVDDFNIIYEIAIKSFNLVLKKLKEK